MTDATRTYINGLSVPHAPKQLTGALSGKPVTLHDDVSGFPASKPFFRGDDYPKSKRTKENAINIKVGEPDQLSSRLKLGLFIPATNTAMEAELWGMLKRNEAAMQGVGIHTVNVMTAKPSVATKEDLAEYGRQFLEGLRASLKEALLAQPQYLIMGMSLEHVFDNMDDIRRPMDQLQRDAGGPGLASWHDAVKAGLNKFGAKKIGMLSPFDPSGDDNARKMFEALGFEVVRSFGMNCATAVDICHAPDWAKEEAIKEYLVNGGEEKIDAIVQCGTNFSLVPVIEAVEKDLDVPVLGINQVLLWYALRECGVNDKLTGCGRLFREF